MKIYNTLTKKKEEFVPIEPGKVRMYVCGPTVYNFIHIGNARPMIVFDTVRRYMEHKGYEVNYVSNFTDVDDKIIKKAVEEGVDANVISERYIAECKKDMASLNVRPATTHPQATQEICGMEEMIRTLIEKGYAYAAEDGTVYYRVRSFKDYGKLSHKNLDDLEGGKRSLLVSGADQKEDPLDFVLWKPKKEGEPFWKSPWCDGRPGWHIECSVMSKKYLGDEIDIHAGGEDLIFPHHENEIAQSTCAHDGQYVNYWMHSGMVMVDREKMSKSLGNFFTVRDVLKYYDAETVRYFLMSGHYRSQLNYSEENLKQARAALERLYTALRGTDKTVAPAGGEAFEARFIEAMDDDFNTADGISTIFELVRKINTAVSAGNATKGTLKAYNDEFTALTNVLGLLYNNNDEEQIPAEITELIEKRKEARKAKDFALADSIRDQIKALGWVVEETRQGTIVKKA